MGLEVTIPLWLLLLATSAVWIVSFWMLARHAKDFLEDYMELARLREEVRKLRETKEERKDAE